MGTELIGNWGGAMKALTLWQPWATAITHGGKRLENRGWPPPASILGKRIAIHAGKTNDHRALAVLRSEGKLPACDIPTGCIVATCIVQGYVTPGGDTPIPPGQVYWYSGPFAWILTDVQTLLEAIPCRGMQGLWDVPPEIAHVLYWELNGPCTKGEPT